MRSTTCSSSSCSSNREGRAPLPPRRQSRRGPTRPRGSLRSLVTWTSRLTLGLGLVAALPASADDWVTAVPACSTQPQGAAVVFEIVYPRVGLPALVAAGEVLVARVRLPAPLTPPPGVQQPRALAGWRAELHGHAFALWGAAPAEHRHRLEPIDVRPDAASTLLYRVSLRVPAWVAPGSYDLALWAPGGAGQARSLVRVLDAGAPPRLAWIDTRERLAQPEPAALPVDVWLIDRAGPEPRMHADPAAAPLLELAVPALALRVGSGLWVLGGCGDEHGMFAQETRSAMVRERRSRIDPRPSPGADRWQPLGEAAKPWPAPGSLRVTPGPLRADVSADAGFGARAELALMLGSSEPRLGQPVSDASWYLAGDIGRAGPAARIVRLRIAAGQQRALLRASGAPGPAAARARYQVSAVPQPARSGQPVQLGVRAPGERAGSRALRVAWRIDPLHSAFGPHALEHRFLALGEHRVEVLVLHADGSAVAGEGRVRVQTARASGCAAAARAQEAAWLLLWPALLLLKRRHGARAGIDSPAGSVPKGLIP